LHPLLSWHASCPGARDRGERWNRSSASGRFVALGTDGFGRSDNRPALRRFFEVDRHAIVVASLATLAQLGDLPAVSVSQAIERYGIDAEAAAPWRR
jgi:pyruvate dehydrogenase E1 component